MTVRRLRLAPSGPAVVVEGLLTPQLYGARADGVTNDTGAFRAALTAMATQEGLSLYIPPGDYLLDTGLTWSSTHAMLIYGDGYASHLIFQGTGQGLTGSSSFCEVRDIRVSGSALTMLAFVRPGGVNISDCTVRNCFVSGGSVFGVVTSGIYFEGVDRGKVLGCTLSGNGRAGAVAVGSVDLTDTSGAPRNFAAGAITFTNATGATYTNNAAVSLGALATVSVPVTSTLAGNSDAAIAAITSSTVANSTCSNPATVVGVDPFGYDVLYGATDHAGGKVSDCVITMTNTTVGIANFDGSDFLAAHNLIDGGGAKNGTFTNSGYCIMGYAQPAHSPVRMRVLGNEVSNSAGSGIYVQGVPNSTIVGNDCFDNGLRQDPTSLPVAGIATNLTSSVSINGNIISGGNQAGISVATAVRQNVAGNVINNPKTFGVHVRGASSGSAVTGNTILGVTYRPTGIQTPGAAVSNLTIAGNTIEHVVDGVNHTGDNNVAVIGNTISDATSHATIATSGARATIVGNIADTTVGGFDYRGSDGLIACNTAYNSTGFAYSISGASSTVSDNRIVGAGTLDLSGATNPTRRNNRLNTGVERGLVNLAGGTVNVASNEIQAGDTIRVTRTTPGGAPGFLSWVVTGAGALTINSSNGADNGQVLWEVVH